MLLHNPVEGMSSFYGGMLHPLVVPDQVLLILTGSLLAGRIGLDRMRRALPLWGLALIACVFLQPTLDWQAPPEVSLALAILGGLVLAAQWSPPLGLHLIWVFAAGSWIGLGTEVDDIPYGEELAFQAGACLGAAVAVLCLSGLAESARGKGPQILMRVMGSWAAAAALIVLAFQFTSP